MPMNFGAFEASLRGRDSPSVDRRMLHKGCSGHLHGHGVGTLRDGETYQRCSKSRIY